MIPEERKSLLFLLVFIPLMIVGFILVIVTIPLWIIGKESFTETIPIKLLEDFIEDYL